MATNRPLARRTFLRGAGIALALPLLESLVTRTAFAAGGGEAAAAAVRQRLLFMYIPNGVNTPDWGLNAAGEFGSILAPLTPHQDDVLLISGLAADKARPHGDGAGDHARSAAAFLTGSQPVKTNGKDIRAGVSVDQIAGKYLGQSTRLATLELGCEPGQLAGSCDSGYSCAYTNSISWRSPNAPAGKETNPRLAFDRIVGGQRPQSGEGSIARQHARRKSVLDLVADDARRLQRRTSGNDRRKVDEYLEGIRDIERRLDTVQPMPGVAMPRPDRAPENFGERIRLMVDLSVLAFRVDATRVITLMVANEGSGRAYPELDIHEGHHPLTHHQRDPKKVQQVAQINRYHAEQFAYLIERLRAAREGETNLLANTAVVYGSGIGDGERHNHDRLPIVVAGQCGGRVATGRHLELPHETPLMNLFVSLLQGVGVPVESVGDSTGPLGGLG